MFQDFLTKLDALGAFVTTKLKIVKVNRRGVVKAGYSTNTKHVRTANPATPSNYGELCSPLYPASLLKQSICRYEYFWHSLTGHHNSLVSDCLLSGR